MNRGRLGVVALHRAAICSPPGPRRHQDRLARCSALLLRLRSRLDRDGGNGSAAATLVSGATIRAIRLVPDGAGSRSAAACDYSYYYYYSCSPPVISSFEPTRTDLMPSPEVPGSIRRGGRRYACGNRRAERHSCPLLERALASGGHRSGKSTLQRWRQIPRILSGWSPSAPNTDSVWCVSPRGPPARGQRDLPQ